MSPKQYIGVRSGSTTTRSQSKLEEQLAMLIAKMDQQSEQLQQLTMQQSERVESVVEQLKETDKHVEAIAGDLDSVKSVVHGRLGDMEESMISMKALQAEFGERRKSSKVELREELFRELSGSVKTSFDLQLHLSFLDLRWEEKVWLPMETTALEEAELLPVVEEVLFTERLPL